MDNSNFFLKQWRVFAFLTQDELGKRMGISGAQVSRMESGVRSPDVLYLIDFMKAVNTALDELEEPMRIPPMFRIQHYSDPLRFLPESDEFLRHNPALLTRLVQLAEDCKEMRDLFPSALPDLTRKVLPFREK